MVQHDFLLLFGASLETTAEVYMVAPKEDVQAYANALAKNRGSYLDATKADDVNVFNLLPPGQKQRWHDYEKLRGDNRLFWADLSQWPDVINASAMATFPCLTTSSRLWSWSANRPVTPTEVLLSQGMPATGLEGTAKQLPVSRSFLAGCSPGAVMGAAGNGLHSGVFGAWWAYCMAHLVPKAAVQGTINLISDTSDSELDDFDLEDM